MALMNLEVTNACNYDCPYCGDNKNREVGFITVPDVKTILAKVPKKFMEVDLFVSGEPLLHSDIADIIRAVKEDGRMAVINTNCSQLEPELNKKIIEAGLDLIRFSQHKPEEVKDKVEQFIEQNKGRVAIENYLLTPENKHSWIEAGSVENAQKPVPKRNVCTSLTDGLSILWNGDVVPCCRDLNGKMVVGNIFEEPYKDIRGKLDELVQRQKRLEPIPEICDDCEIYQTIKKRKEGDK